MSTRSTGPGRARGEALSLSADVLIVGGGPAATWAAVTAAHEGARVVLVDKGYCGTSGVAATAGVGHWIVPPELEAREQALDARERIGGLLSDRDRTNRALDEIWTRLPQLEGWGYPFPRDDQGQPFRRIGQSPHYLRFMRNLVRRFGVTILDHSPALELLTDSDGEVAGASGYQRQARRPWTVSAGAVVLATGGCTWKSKSLGGDVNTGDGQLMAAEVGAHLASMELSSFYGIVPKGTSMDKNGYFLLATFTREDGTEIDGELFGSRGPLLQAYLDGGVFARFDRAPEEAWPAMRAAMPNFFMVTDKLGIDPFRQRFPIDFVLEGTVRGTGGLHVGDDGATGVPGLYAAGDVASRAEICGAATGAGGPNLCWAVASGTWAGRAASRFARQGHATQRAVHGAGRIGLRPHATPGQSDDWRALTRAVQAEVLPVEKNGFRTERGLRNSLAVLEDLWRVSDASLRGEGVDAVYAREASAMLAMARWSYASALERTESRGMHTRSDYPATDPAQQHRILSGGLDEVWTAIDPRAPVVGNTTKVTP